jgi:hypothetical protein
MLEERLQRRIDMSHVVGMGMRFRSLECLARAGEECGMELIKQSNYRWFGRYMSDSPLPEGFTADELGKCAYILRVKGKDNEDAYEVGVVPSKTHPGEWELLYDSWGTYGAKLMKAIGEGGNKLKQSYTLNIGERHARKLGLRPKRIQQANGHVILRSVR